MKKDDTDEKYYKQYPEALLAGQKPEKFDLTLTECEDKHERASVQYWKERIEASGNHKGIFLDAPQERIDRFTARHRAWVEPWVKGKDVLEIGCGYGRTMDMFKEARIYVGVECVDELVAEAWENWERVFGKYTGEVLDNFKGYVCTADLRRLRYLTTDGHGLGVGSPLATKVKFDICVAIAVISSVEPFFHDLVKRIFRMLRPGGVILWLEEKYTRIDYK